MKILDSIDLTQCILHSMDATIWQSYVMKEHSEDRIFPDLDLDTWDILDYHEQHAFDINPWQDAYLDTSLYVLRKPGHPMKVGARCTFRVWDYNLGDYCDFTMGVPERLLPNGEQHLFENIDKFTINIASTTVEQDGKLQERIKDLYIYTDGVKPIWIPESAFGTNVEFGTECNGERIVSFNPLVNDMDSYGAIHVYVPDLNKETIFQWIRDTLEVEEKAIRKRNKNRNKGKKIRP